MICRLIGACRLHITFVDKDGHQNTFEVAEGDNLLDIAQANDLEMEGEPVNYCLWAAAAAAAAGHSCCV